MKRLLHSIYAMALLNPQLTRQKSISVEVEQGGEGPIPHVHVYLDKSRNPSNCAYIRLDKAAYSSHHKGSSRLDKKQLEEFIEIMSTPWHKYVIDSSTGYRPATGYEAAVNIWLDTYGGSLDDFSTDENGDLIMPDYWTL